MDNFAKNLTKTSNAAREKLLHELYTTFRYLDSLQPLITEKLKTELLTRAESAYTDITLDICELRKLIPELELIPNKLVYNKAISKITTWSLKNLNLITLNTETKIYASW